MHTILAREALNNNIHLGVSHSRARLPILRCSASRGRREEAETNSHCLPAHGKAPRGASITRLSRLYHLGPRLPPPPPLAFADSLSRSLGPSISYVPLNLKLRSLSRRVYAAAASVFAARSQRGNFMAARGDYYFADCALCACLSFSPSWGIQAKKGNCVRGAREIIVEKCCSVCISAAAWVNCRASN